MVVRQDLSKEKIIIIIIITLTKERMMTQLHEDLENSIQSNGPASAKAEQEMSLSGKRKEG